MKDYDVYIFDYEGTLSEAPSNKLNLRELLFNFDFRKLKPNKNIYDFVNSLERKRIFVVGIVECNKEVEQKYEWIEKYFPMIKKQDCIFISSDYKKSEVIYEIMNKNAYTSNQILFVDDKESHINDVKQLGIDCILTENI